MVEHGVTGLVSPVRDSFALSEQLKLLLDNESLRLEIGHHAKAFAAAHWSLDLMIERVLGIYHSALTK
ncbi:hypothetical protein D3C86_1719360 [compost metagenome]